MPKASEHVCEVEPECLACIEVLLTKDKEIMGFIGIPECGGWYYWTPHYCAYTDLEAEARNAVIGAFNSAKSE